MQCWLLQDLSRRRGHQSTLRRRVLALEVVAHLLHRLPLHAFVLVDVFDDSVSEISIGPRFRRAEGLAVRA